MTETEGDRSPRREMGGTRRDVLPPGAESVLPAASGGQRAASTPVRAPRPRAGGTDGEPPLTLTADEGTNTLIAVGEPRRLAQLAELIRVLDVRQPQVMIELLVVNLTEWDRVDRGVEL